MKIEALDEIVDSLVDWAVEHELVRALWIEAASLAGIRRPYKTLEMHLCADEPEYPQVIRGLPEELERVVGAKILSRRDTERLAQEFSLSTTALEWTLIAEQSNLLAKRPRAEVVPLVDKTGHLPHVLNYSLRSR